MPASFENRMGPPSTKPTDRQSSKKLITFRYNDSEVWVKLDTYQKAVGLAKSEYPELRHVAPERIVFFVRFIESGKTVRISESAWPDMLARFGERSVIDISLTEKSDEKEEMCPPQYHSVESASDSPCGPSDLKPLCDVSQSSGSLHKLSKLLRR